MQLNFVRFSCWRGQTVWKGACVQVGTSAGTSALVVRGVKLGRLLQMHDSMVRQCAKSTVHEACTRMHARTSMHGLRRMQTLDWTDLVWAVGLSRVEVWVLDAELLAALHEQSRHVGMVHHPRAHEREDRVAVRGREHGGGEHHGNVGCRWHVGFVTQWNKTHGQVQSGAGLP